MGIQGDRVPGLCKMDAPVEEALEQARLFCLIPTPELQRHSQSPQPTSGPDSPSGLQRRFLESVDQAALEHTSPVRTGRSSVCRSSPAKHLGSRVVHSPQCMSSGLRAPSPRQTTTIQNSVLTQVCPPMMPASWSESGSSSSSQSPGYPKKQQQPPGLHTHQPLQQVTYIAATAPATATTSASSRIQIPHQLRSVDIGGSTLWSRATAVKAKASTNAARKENNPPAAAIQPAYSSINASHPAQSIVRERIQKIEGPKAERQYGEPAAHMQLRRTEPRSPPQASMRMKRFRP